MSERPQNTLPRRDYIILPLLSLLTVVVMFCITEITTRVFWQKDEDNPCRVPDSRLRFRYLPNCTARIKAFESPWVDHAYNDCGYRSKASCRNRARRTIRIALLGTSFSEGYMVPYDSTVGGLSERELTRVCRRPVEIQNLSALVSTMDVYHRVDAALDLHPDLVMILLAPHDVEYMSGDKEMASRKDPRPINPGDNVVAAASPLKRLSTFLKGSRTMQVAQHFLFQNGQTYVRLYLLYGDHADFLRSPLTPLWETRFAKLDVLLGEMADAFHSHGIPTVFVAGMQRAEAQLLSSHDLPSGIDPYAFERETSEISAKHGIISIEVDRDFSRLPDAGRFFYPVDGHLNTEGSELFGTYVWRQLLAKDLPVFSGCSTGTRSD